MSARQPGNACWGTVVVGAAVIGVAPATVVGVAATVVGVAATVVAVAVRRATIGVVAIVASDKGGPAALPVVVDCAVVEPGVAFEPAVVLVALEPGAVVVAPFGPAVVVAPLTVVVVGVCEAQGYGPASTSRNRSSAVSPTRPSAFCRSFTPGRFTTIVLPWRCTSGSAIPSPSTRLRMTSAAVFERAQVGALQRDTARSRCRPGGRGRAPDGCRRSTWRRTCRRSPRR